MREFGPDAGQRYICVPEYYAPHSIKTTIKIDGYRVWMQSQRGLKAAFWKSGT